MSAVHEIVLRIRIEIDPPSASKTTPDNFEPETPIGTATKTGGRPVKRRTTDIIALLDSKGLSYADWKNRAKWESRIPPSTFGRLLRNAKAARQVEQRGQKYFAVAGKGPGQGEGCQNPSPLGEGFDPNAQGPEPTSGPADRMAEGKEAGHAQ